jgi:MFS family permease
VIAPTALALIATTFAEGPAGNRAIGMYVAPASVGFVAGLVLGGVLVTSIGWRAVFWVNVPIGVAAVVLGWVSVPAAQHHGPAGAALAIGYGQALLFAAGLAAAAVVVSAGFMPASHANRTCDPGTRLGLLPELEPHR